MDADRSSQPSYGRLSRPDRHFRHAASSDSRANAWIDSKYLSSAEIVPSFSIPGGLPVGVPGFYEQVILVVTAQGAPSQPNEAAREARRKRIYEATARVAQY